MGFSGIAKVAMSSSEVERGGFVCCCRYGYIRNHKKAIINGQARTRERKSDQKPEAKPLKKSTLSQAVKGKSIHGQQKDSSVKSRAIIGLLKHRAHVAMEEAQRGVGFALNTLTQLAQAVTSKNDSLAIRVSVHLIQRLKLMIQ
ncbi:hypothetical protein Tco_0996331 [Tanacetum coccineum]